MTGNSQEPGGPAPRVVLIGAPQPAAGGGAAAAERRRCAGGLPGHAGPPGTYHLTDGLPLTQGTLNSRLEAAQGRRRAGRNTL